MKVSSKWLKTMVEIPVDLGELTERLDMTGTAVEAVEVIGAAFEGIVVGQILTREKHPDADKLWVTTVDVGGCSLGKQPGDGTDGRPGDDGQPAAGTGGQPAGTDGRPGDDGQPGGGQLRPLQIVCGAQNFVAGDKVPVAMVGAKLPDGTVIKKAKMRGLESMGMNCSARELGLGDDHAGLMILEPTAVVGMPIAEHLGLSDTIIDLEITPNRPDCMSMFGIAREVGAIYGKPYGLGREVVGVGAAAAGEPASADATAAAAAGEPAEKLVKLSIADAERCPRYTARIIKGVRIGPSPEWLAERVRAAGARSINNIVDVTNYIMFELGQPLHAFDLDTLAKDSDGRAHVVVRAATDGEHFTTLDGVQRLLDPDITCIVDGNAESGAGQTIALAGVMGGLESEVTDSTVNILLESATFASANTSRTSRKLQLFSEASARYERGVDAAACDSISARAAALMVEVAGGVVCESAVDAYPLPPLLPKLRLRSERLRQFVGADISAAESSEILTRLGCTVQAADGPGGATAPHALHIGKPSNAWGEPDLLVTPPSFRPDLTREIDLYEEVLRIWGMERVRPTLPGGRGRIGEKTVEQQRMDVVGRALRASGLNQTMTYAFASPTDDQLLQMPFEQHQQPVELINPMNSEQGQLRRSILPGLLRSVAYNLSRGVANVRLYECGTVFFAADGRKLPKERQMLAAVLSGSLAEPGWNSPAQAADFFDGKGIVENLLRELNIVKLRFKPLAAEEALWLQPGRGAEVYAGSKLLGWLGEIHPRTAAAFEVDKPIIAFELDIKSLLSAAAQSRPYKDVPQYPAVQLDLAVVVDESVTAEKLTQVIGSAAGALLDELRLFDVYRDADKLGPGKKSLAFALFYRASDRTLTFEEVEKLHQKVIAKLSAATGGEVRS